MNQNKKMSVVTLDKSRYIEKYLSMLNTDNFRKLW